MITAVLYMTYIMGAAVAGVFVWLAWELICYAHSVQEGGFIKRWDRICARVRQYARIFDRIVKADTSNRRKAVEVLRLKMTRRYIEVALYLIMIPVSVAIIQTYFMDTGFMKMLKQNIDKSGAVFYQGIMETTGLSIPPGVNPSQYIEGDNGEK
jgi:hypothetical protein